MYALCKKQAQIEFVMEEKVLAVLRGGALKAGEIAEKTGIEKKDVDKVIKKLVAEGKVDSPKRCFYGLKE